VEDLTTKIFVKIKIGGVHQPVSDIFSSDIFINAISDFKKELNYYHATPIYVDYHYMQCFQVNRVSKSHQVAVN